MKKQAPNSPQPKHKEPKRPKQMWSPAPSLHPSVTMMNAYVEGHPYARAAVASWQFRAPVTTLSREAYAALIDRCNVVL